MTSFIPAACFRSGTPNKRLLVIIEPVTEHLFGVLAECRGRKPRSALRAIELERQRRGLNHTLSRGMWVLDQVYE